MRYLAGLLHWRIKKLDKLGPIKEVRFSLALSRNQINFLKRYRNDNSLGNTFLIQNVHESYC